MGNRAGSGARGNARSGARLPEKVQELFDKYSQNNITVLVRKGYEYTRYDKGNNKPTDRFKFYGLDVKLPELIKKGRNVLIVD